MRGCSCAEVVFLTCATLTRQRAACASQTDSITLAGPVSQRTLNAACLRVKVESIKILTARPALNWPCHALCLSHAIIMPSDVTVETWRWEHARTGEQHWVQRRVSAAACGWQSTNKLHVNHPTDHGWISIQKFRIVVSVSNRIE